MNMSWTIYDLGTGEVQKTISVPDLEHLNANIDEGCAAIEGHWPPETYRIENGAAQALPSSQPLLALLHARAIAKVNRQIGDARSQFITIAPGQEMIYAAKEAEAIRYLALAPDALDPSEFPFLAAEAGILAGTAYEVAQIWINMSAVWRGIAAQLEALRIATCQALESADGYGIPNILAQFDHDLSVALNQN